MKQYLDLLKRVLINGDPQYNARTGQLMIVSSGDQCKFDLRKGFPLCTTKASAPIRWVAEEVFWMLRGERNAKTLDAKGVDIWNRNAFQYYLKKSGLEKQIPKNTLKWNQEFNIYQERMRNGIDFNFEDSDLGPIYGFQWRHWPGKNGRENDQVKNLLDSIKRDPGSRYHTLSAWNVDDLEEMALKPCHAFAHFTITDDAYLDVHMFQRSCDVYLGVPFNIAQYALMNHLIGIETGFLPREFIHTYSNVHIYGGVAPRSNFLKENLRELQERVKEVNFSDDYLKVREWYLQNSPAESEGNEKKDHVPFVLEQLSKTPQTLPAIFIKQIPFFEIIEKPSREVIRLEGYNPLKWESKAVMAA